MLSKSAQMQVTENYFLYHRHSLRRQVQKITPHYQALKVRTVRVNTEAVFLKNIFSFIWRLTGTGRIIFQGHSKHVYCFHFHPTPRPHLNGDQTLERKNLLRRRKILSFKCRSKLVRAMSSIGVGGWVGGEREEVKKRCKLPFIILVKNMEV